MGLLDTASGTYVSSREPSARDALPGQPGHGHVNTQPPEKWVLKVVRMGYRVNANLTAALRRHASVAWLGERTSCSALHRAMGWKPCKPDFAFGGTLTAFDRVEDEEASASEERAGTPSPRLCDAPGTAARPSLLGRLFGRLFGASPPAMRWSATEIVD